MKSKITSVNFILRSLLVLCAIMGVVPCTAQTIIHIGPDLAVTQGAQWRIVGQDTWYDSNVGVALPPGMNTLEFKNLLDWVEPATLSVIDAENTTQTIDVNYTALSRFAVGEIPAQIVWQDQTLEFMVCLADANGVTVTDAAITAQTQPSPIGAVIFMPATEPGYFVLSYKPDVQDRDDFQVILEGQSPSLSAKICQLVQITPMQTLADEAIIFKTGQYTKVLSGEPALRTNQDTLSGSTEPFNYKTVKTRTISIEGNHIEISKLDDTNGLYAQLAATTDSAGNVLNANIKTLQIVADVLIIKTRLWLPGTQVTIKAVELYFEDEDTANPACIVTTPVGLTTRPVYPAGATQGTNGRAGLNAGNITIDVLEFHSAQLPNGTTPLRFVLNGGNGEPGGSGRNGIAGPALDCRDSMQVRMETWLGTDRWWSSLYSAPPYKITSVLYYDNSGTWDFDWDTSPTGWGGSTTLPHGGNAVPGGKPGAGGNAGQLRCTLPIDSLYSYNGGQKGQRAPTYPGGAAGTPTYYLQLIYTLGGNLSCDVGYYGWAHAGNNAYPPDDSDIPTGQIGTYQVVASSMEQFTPENFLQNLNIIRQFYLANQIDVCTQKISKYLQLIDLYKQGAGWQALPLVRKCRVETVYNDLRSIQNRIENGLDYYGNPAGWVPMLSFEVNRTIFDNEVDRAINTLYLSYWLKEEATTAQQRVGALTDTIDNLKGEIQTLKQRYDEAVASMPDLETKAIFLKQQIEVVQGKLKWRETELRNQAEDNLREPWWKTGLKIAGSICSMIPVGQPALGAIGGGMSLAANFDENDPWATITGAADITSTLISSQFKEKAEAQKDDLDQANTEQAEDPEENAALLGMLSGGGSSMTSAVKQISGIISAREAPKDKIDAELARLAAQDPTFQALSDEIKDLLDKKASFAKEIASAVQDISSIPNQISTNVQAINSFVREKASTQAALSNEAIEYLTSMENRANDRLIKYHYYLAKGYEYRLLKPYANPLDLTPMFNKFKEIAVINTPSNHILGPDQFASLKALYEDILAGIAEEIFDEYNRNARPEYTVTARFNLLPEELAAINAGKPLVLNPVDIGLFNGVYEENLRIVDLSVYAITAAADDGVVGDTAYVDLRIEHPGESKIKSDGTVYLFRYSEGGDSRPIEWGGRFDLVSQSLEAIRPSAASESLLRSLLKGDASSDMMLYSQPSAWGDLKISKSSVNTTRNSHGVVTRDNISIQSLRLQLTYDFVRKNTNLAEFQVGVVQADQSGDIASQFKPYCRVSRIDENDRKDGRGQFLRVFRKSPTDTVVFSAQPIYGKWMFHSWVDQYGEPISFAVPGSTEIALPLTSDYRLFARYIPREGLAGDFNADRTVDFSDFALLARFYGTQCNSLEFDGIGQIGLSDVVGFSDYWLMNSQTVPSNGQPVQMAAPAMSAPLGYNPAPANSRAIEIVETVPPE